MYLTDSYLSPILHTLSAVSERQKLTSANLANAHTPGYTARSASFSDILQGYNPLETELSRKMGSHISEVNYNTGKPVDMQQELIDMQKNLLFYSMASRRATSIFTGLKAAAQVGR